MSWFEDHAQELEDAGISQEQARDFESRNPGDFDRLIEANTNDTGDRDFDSQSENYDQATNQLSEQGRAATAGLPPQQAGGGTTYSAYLGRTVSDAEYARQELGSKALYSEQLGRVVTGDEYERLVNGGQSRATGQPGMAPGAAMAPGVNAAQGFGSVPQPFGETYSMMGRPSWRPPSGQQGGGLWAGPDGTDTSEMMAMRPERGGGRDIPMTRSQGSTQEHGIFTPPTWQGGDFQAPTMPGALQTPYVAPTWQGGDFQAPTKPGALQGAFAAPTMAEVQAGPGYQTRLDTGRQARERSAAAKGTVLNGGTQKALERYGQDYGANEYGAEFDRRLTGRQQAQGEYQTDYGNAANQYAQRYGQFQDAASSGLAGRQQQQGEYQTAYGNAANAYTQRYGQFGDAAARGANAWGMNENAYQTDVTNNLNQYNTRYRSYLDSVANTRNSENDLFNRNQTLVDNSLRAAALARPY